MVYESVKYTGWESSINFGNYRQISSKLKYFLQPSLTVEYLIFSAQFIVIYILFYRKAMK